MCDKDHFAESVAEYEARGLITRRQFTTVTGHFKPKIIDLGIWRYPATAFVALVVFILDVVPLLSVLGGRFMTRFGFFNLPKTWTLDYWNMALGFFLYGGIQYLYTDN